MVSLPLLSPFISVGRPRPLGDAVLRIPIFLNEYTGKSLPDTFL
jgi:hypothetical protein